MAASKSETKSTRKPAARKKPAASPAPAGPSTASKALSAFSIGALAVAVGAAAWEAFRRLRAPGEPGTVPTDLMGEDHPGAEDRAIDAFRPDPTAPVPAAEREALRPATLPNGAMAGA